MKKRYIAEKEKELSVPSDYIDVQFRKAANMEYEKDKDLCDWSTYEIIEYYKILNIYSFDYLLKLNNILSNYTAFCLKNGLVKDNQNHYLECTAEIIVGCLNKTIIEQKIVDRKTVLDWVEQLPNPKDQFILLSLFEYGKSKDFKDIVYAKKSDVNGNELKLFDRTVKISYKLVDIIDDCWKEDKYYSMTGKEERIYTLRDDGYIVKCYPNQSLDASDFQKGRNIYITCQRIFKYLGAGEWMTPNAISESGKLHMIKERAKELNISPKEYVLSDYIKEVEKQFNCEIRPSVYFYKYGEYLD